METKTRAPRDWAFLRAELPHNLSRQNVIIPAGTGKVLAGTVIGELTASEGHFVPSPAAVVEGKEGAEAAVAVLGASVDATSDDQMGVAVCRIADVMAEGLAFDASVDDETKNAAKMAQLKAAGIRAVEG